MAKRLELDPDVERIIGVDTGEPSLQLTRTELVRGAGEAAVLDAIIRRAAIDTVVEVRPPLPAQRGSRQTVTRQLIAALDSPGSPVGKLVFRSSAQYYGFDAAAPAFWDEDAIPRMPVSPGYPRLVFEADTAIRAFAGRRPEIAVTVLRCADVIGPEADGVHMRLLRLPAIPCLLGFDPRWQFVHHNDEAGAMVHAVQRSLPGVYNVAADGVLALSEVGSLLGKRVLPVLPPFGLGAATRVLRRAALPAPVELIEALRYGRGLDNRRFKASGFAFRYTTREAILRLEESGRQRAELAVQDALQER